jgi:hypothetical protein
MRKAREKPIEEQVDYSYEGKPPMPNLLDYRYMGMLMNRSPDTGKLGCMGTFTMALTLVLSCTLGLALIVMASHWR